MTTADTSQLAVEAADSYHPIQERAVIHVYAKTKHCSQETGFFVVQRGDSGSMILDIFIGAFLSSKLVAFHTERGLFNV
jgi:hypothetical protein